ncbi:MAG: type II secretion system F family protein [Polyangiales bacterium]
MSTSLGALQLLLFAVTTAAVGCFTWALVSAPSLPPERLGLRGYKRTLALRDNTSFAQVEPLVRWLSTRIGGLLSPQLRSHLNQQITQAGDVLGLQAEDVVSFSILSCGFGLAWGITYSQLTHSGYLFAVIAMAAGAFGPYLQLQSHAQKRVRIIQRTLPSVVDLMVLGLSAGLDFTAAVKQVIEHAGRTDEPLIEELRLLLQELKLGHTRREALQQLSERAPCEAVRDLVASVVQSESQGTPLAAVLAAQAVASRQRRSVNAEETAAKAGASLAVPLGLLFLATLLLIVAPMVLSLAKRF